MTVVKNVGKKRKKVQPKVEDILSLIDSCTQEEDLTPWSGTLEEYLPVVAESPYLNELAHARIWRMVESDGITFEDHDDKKKLPLYEFYKKELFGVDHVLSQIMQYFKAAAAGSEVSRRILLLWGPTSSGKSQFATMLKKGLEKFSRTVEGRMFALADCPMHENPLNAMPWTAREMLKQKYGLLIEGELCPRCAYRLEHDFQGDWKKLPVKRVFLSETNRIGIGTFQPGDTKSQSQSELVGSVNFAKLEDYGVESHPLAYNFDGELNVANRGMMEFIELLKVDPKFRHILLTLAQEKRIKVERFPLIYADLVPVAHSVTGDTPIFYKDCDLIRCTTMEKLYEENKTGIQVLATSNEGKPIWTNVKNLYRHAFTGDLVRTIQCDGVVETTYNHSIIGEDCKPFYPEERKNLLHFRTIPEATDMPEFVLQIPPGLQVEVVENRLYVAPTGDKKVDGEYGKYGVQFDYKCGSQESHDILKVLAWFVTEGHVNSTHAIISQADISVLDDLKQSVERISSTTASLHDRTDKEDGTSRLHLSSRVWREILEYNCGKYAENKKLPNFVFNMPKYMKEFLLDEMIKGDGSTNCSVGSEEYKNKYFRYKTTSKILASQFGFLLAQLDIDFNVSFAYTSSGKESYEIRFRHKKNDGNRQNRIERIPVENVMVYDIGCEDNHSFTCGVGNVVCHNTNETEFNRFVADKKEEALHDRIWVVKFPYNLKLDEEVRIYEKLICQTPGFQGTHIAPHTLKIAAMFAILSRLEEPKDKSITPLQKMRLYNGEHVDGFSPENIKGLQEDADREGLDGISPRYVVNRLAACFAKYDVQAVTPIAAIRSLKEGLPTNAKLDKDQIARLEDIASICIEEYSKIATNDVQKAFFVNFEHEIKNLLSNYIDNIGAYLDDARVENDWGDMVEADERLMRSVEEKVEVTSSGKDSFRQEVYRKMIKSKSQIGEYDYQSHPKLREALQKQLFDERKDVIRLTVSSRNPDPEGLKKLNEVVSALVDKYDYNAESANELLRYVSDIMSKNN